MKSALNLASWLGLALTLVPSFLFLSGNLSSGRMNWYMAAGMVLWFVARTLRETWFRPTEVSAHAVEPDSPHTL